MRSRVIITGAQNLGEVVQEYSHKNHLTSCWSSAFDHLWGCKHVAEFLAYRARTGESILRFPRRWVGPSRRQGANIVGKEPRVVSSRSRGTIVPNDAWVLRRA